MNGVVEVLSFFFFRLELGFNQGVVVKGFMPSGHKQLEVFAPSLKLFAIFKVVCHVIDVRVVSAQVYVHPYKAMLNSGLEFLQKMPRGTI